jgi:hypothetical protein
LRNERPAARISGGRPTALALLLIVLGLAEVH